MGLWHEHSPFQTAINAEKSAAGDQSNRGCPIEGDGRRSESGPCFALRVCIEMSQPKISTGEELLPQGPLPSLPLLVLFTLTSFRSSSSAHSLFAPSHVRGILYTGRRRGEGALRAGDFLHLHGVTDRLQEATPPLRAGDDYIMAFSAPLASRRGMKKGEET